MTDLRRMSKILSFWAAALALGFSPLPARERAESEPVIRVYREIDGRRLEAHVFQPDHRTGSNPGILLFHGGGWSVGEPEWTYDAARRFSGHGLLAIAVEYRLSEGDITPIEALADVCESFRWARENASDLGLDADRLAGYGVSAGGHLLASTATVGCPGDDSEVRAEPDVMLLWSPALDMARDGWFQRKLQGRRTAEAFSPLQHVRPSTPPTSIVQGAEDTLTPLAGARAFCERMEKLSGACDLHVYEDVGHLLTRNLEYQEGDFDPDPRAVATGVAAHLGFLRDRGFLAVPIPDE